MLTRFKPNLFLFCKHKDVKFDFELPREKVQQVITPSNEPPKLIKLNRKKVQQQSTLIKIQPKFSQISGLSETEIQYNKTIEEKIQKNKATHRYYNYELSRGEDLIDNVPIDPYYQYKREDLNKQIEKRKQYIRKLNNVKTAIDPNKLKKLRTIVNNYHNMKHRYELEQFLKKIEEYPGSVAGPKPSDDLVVFGQYVNQIMPQWVRGQLQLLTRQKKSNQVVEQGYHIQPTHTTHSQILSQNKTLVSRFEKMSDNKIFQSFKKSLGQTAYPKQLVHYDDVPIVPHTQFQEYHEYMFKLEAWSKFRHEYDKINKEKKHKRIQENIRNLQKLINQKREKKQQPKIFSLFAYYKTLPKEMQNHPGVLAAYLGLEYCQADLTYQQKVQGLNLACKMALPLDKFSQSAMQTLLNQTKTYLTPHLTDRIFNMNPEFTWDINEFLQQVKDEKLRSISTVKQKQESYPEPPKLHLREQKDVADLPVDFYDNEDGFWDDHIDKKLKKYEKVHPLPKMALKKHFIH